MTEGNLVANGDTLTTIVSQDPVYVYFDAPERVVLRWDKVVGDEARSGLTARARAFVGLLNEEGFPREGTVDFSDNEVSAGTGTLKMRAVVPNDDRRLRIGMFARVRLTLDQPHQTLLVPERAVAVLIRGSDSPMWSTATIRSNTAKFRSDKSTTANLQSWRACSATIA